MSGQHTELVFQPSAPWETERYGTTIVHRAGDPAPVWSVLKILEDTRTLEIEELSQFLRQQTTHFAALIRRNGLVLGVVDRMRSFPLYYTTGPGHSFLGNNARALSEAASKDVVDESGLLQFVMTGYVTGRRTMYAGLCQFQTGEIAYNQTEGGLEVHRYYRYVPQPDQNLDEKEALFLYGQTVESVFRRTIDAADGRPIWIPLSGGYDSRIIACKLHELGYDNVTTFSYGPSQNYDARVARHVAEKLSYPWHWIRSDANESRQFFFNRRRREYWNFADGLSAIPSQREYHALTRLTEAQKIPRDAVLINGQTGDFLTGGHIPDALYQETNPPPSSLVNAIVNKHWSLWTHLKRTAAFDLIHQSLSESYTSTPGSIVSRDALVSHYEAWECEERQCKFVVNGQRMYEHFGLSWLLPHWDGEFLDFWKSVPVELKYRQKLYKTWLKSWNYAELFRDYDPFVWRWPRHMMWVVPLARILGVIAGRPAKDDFYKFMWYFSHYHNHYSIYGYRNFLKTWRSARSPISLQVAVWLQEHDIDPSTVGAELPRLRLVS